MDVPVWFEGRVYLLEVVVYWCKAGVGTKAVMSALLMLMLLERP